MFQVYTDRIAAASPVGLQEHLNVFSVAYILFKSNAFKWPHVAEGCSLGQLRLAVLLVLQHVCTGKFKVQRCTSELAIRVEDSGQW